MPNVPALTDQVDFESDAFGYTEILKWADSPDGGALPTFSAGPFASWLNETWNEFEGDEIDDDDVITYEGILTAALDTWTGGRYFSSTDTSKSGD